MSDFDLSALYNAELSLNEGALTIPGYTMDGWYGRIYRGSGFFDPDKPIKEFTKRELHDLLYKEPTKIKVDGINLTYEGLIPKIQKSMLSKDVEALQPHIRAFVERAITFTTCPDCEGTRLTAEARSSKPRASTSPMPARCRSATSSSGCTISTSRPLPRSSPVSSTSSTPSWRSGWVTSPWTGRRARSQVGSPSGPR